MRRTTLALGGTLSVLLGPPAAPAANGDVVTRLEHLDGRLTAALVALRDRRLPRRFVEVVDALDREALELGAGLPRLGGGPARGSVVYRDLRRADSSLGLARKHLRLGEPGGGAAIRSAAGSLGSVARELGSDPILQSLSARFRRLAARARATTPSDERARALIVQKDTLLEGLPPLAGVPFGAFYVQSFTVHARIGHARRTTLHDEPETVRSDLIGARLMTRMLLAEFREER